MLDSRTRARGLVLAAICAAALGLAACGDDDDDDTTAPTTTEAEAGDLETTETTETTDGSGEPAEANGDVVDVLRSQLEAAGVESSQADCVIDELESSLGEETLEELQETQEPSQEVIDASTEAAQKCLKP